jgi:hypothetical protein
MKLYRVTIKNKQTGAPHLVRVVTSRKSVSSLKGHWGSRWNRGANDYRYTISVDTMFTHDSDWTPINYEIEALEEQIIKLRAASLDQAQAFVERLANRIQYEKVKAVIATQTTENSESLHPETL